MSVLCLALYVRSRYMSTVQLNAINGGVICNQQISNQLKHKLKYAWRVASKLVHWPIATGWLLVAQSYNPSQCVFVLLECLQALSQASASFRLLALSLDVLIGVVHFPSAFFYSQDIGLVAGFCNV